MWLMWPLDKRLENHPIGIYKVTRRIIGKAILTVNSDDIQQAAGTLQLFAGLAAGIKGAIHAMRHIYNNDRTEALLLVDTENAFHTLNRYLYSRTPKVEHQISMVVRLWLQMREQSPLHEHVCNLHNAITAYAAINRDQEGLVCR